jgi:hypothetical protein
MTARFAVLMVAAIVLSACGTTSDDGVSSTGPSKRLVVRGAVVPDEPAPIATSKKTKAKVRKASAVAVAEAPASDASTTDATVPLAAPSTSNTSGGGTDGGGGTPAVAEPPSTIVADGSVSPTAPSPSEVTTTPLSPVEPSTVTAEPVGDAPPTPTPSPLAIDFRDMLNTTIAGFPLWLMVVVGILLAAALVFGTGGRRERTPERDYRDDREPDYEERTYADRHSDAEPEPA